MRKKLALFLFFALLVSPGFSQSKQIEYLSGTGSDKTTRWDFFCTGGRQSGFWTKIQVPSCWEQQGFGNYNYGRDYKTYGKNFRFADEKGVYKYSFTLPASWKGKQVSIVFDGSMTDTEVKINGKAAGPVHRGAFYRFKYDISDKLQFGKPNILEVTVSKMSADASVNNAERLADYWIFGGIFRPVYLEAVAPEHIDYTAIDAKADGSFAMQVFVKNIQQQRTIEADIVDVKGKIVGSARTTANKNDSVVTLSTKLNNILSWTSETPNLYKVNVYLKAVAKIICQTTEKFGFRTIEIRKGDGIYLNGVQIKMKGVNRHCLWPETGRTLNDSIQLLDVQLIKEMNMNAVRCSHYPPDVKFLELCDSLGLYVLDELAGWQKEYTTPAGEPLVKEMVLRDLNHPSIIFWDNGNEGGTNKELDDDFAKWDFSKRAVIHPHHRPGNAFNGIDCNHYEDYYSTQNILSDSLIYMPTEFLHSQDDGGAGAGMSDFWELHWHAKRSGGGFIWAMLDEGVVRTDFNNVVDADGVNAPDGILGPHREKEGSFFALQEIFSPVKIELKALPPNFDGKIRVENRFHFTNINQCSFQYALVNYYKPQDTFPGYAVEQKGHVNVGSILPGASGDIVLNIPTDYKKYDAVVLVGRDPFNREIYKWIWKIKSNEQLLAGFLFSNDSITSVAETDTSYVLTGGEVSIMLNKRTGFLAGTKNASSDNLSFKNGPVLVQGSGNIVSSKQYRDGNKSAVEFTYDGNMKTARWTMYGSGWVGLEYVYALNGSYPFSGISFNYPENFVLGAKWLGKGPYRQWKNRTAGTPVNVWQSLYNNTQTGYSPNLYPEFKGYYGEITWMEFNTVEGKFYVASKDTGLYVRLFDFYGLTGAKPHPELPVGNISFLDCIPPIGTKLALNINYNTAALGPQSEPTRINGPVKRNLYFYFGLPKTTTRKKQYSRSPNDNVF
jgi:Glycosyl hydrolases family 2, TIM barrel domain/Glycosyl hydrolases family 2, sugar binding domain/Glycosyl hydrolases family 2/Beta galactosidase small chain